MRLQTLFLLCMLPVLVISAPLQSTFTYQGSLAESENIVSGLYDFQVELFDDPDSGAQAGSTVTAQDVVVEGGIFTLELDFGTAPFAGDQLWLEISVRQGSSNDGYTSLLPRQKLTPAPYALHAEMVAMDAIGSAEIASSSVGTSEIDSTQVQRRIQASCPSGSAIRQIDANGEVICEADDAGASFWTPGTTNSLEPDRSVRIQPGTVFPLVVRHASTITDPQLALTDSTDSDFARLSFYNDAQSFGDIANPLMWTIAASITGADSTDRMNFYNRRFGDVMSLTGDGLVGINTSNPLAALDLRSDDQWTWAVGNGRGDFHLGDGQVGLSMGVALNGGGRGASRIWTKGGAEQLFLGSDSFGELVTLSAGNIGLGNANPAVAVDISGQIRSRLMSHGDSQNRTVMAEPDGDLVTMAPQTHYLSISPTNFVVDSNTTPYSRNMQFVTLTASGFQQLYAPVTLPDGARVTELQAWFVDGSSENLNFQLRYYNHVSDSGFGPMAFFTSSGSETGIRSAADNTIAASTIDNENRNYALWVFSENWDSGFRINSVRIAYVQ